MDECDAETGLLLLPVCLSVCHTGRWLRDVAATSVVQCTMLIAASRDELVQLLHAGGCQCTENHS